MMPQDLTISILQTDLVWESPDQNLNRISEKLAALAGHTDLIVLPEMFTTGFSMRAADLAENLEGKTLNWMQRKAVELQSAITGSYIVVEKGHFYNRLLWVNPDATFLFYDKKHLFSLSEEHKYYTAGTQRLIINYRDWRICPLICYDLRFPVWSRNHNEYDLLIYVANWPQTRRQHWQTLLLARAIENQVYTIGVNRVGKDGNNLLYTGDSAIINFAGETLCQLAQTETIVTCQLDLEQQNVYRQQLAFLKDADSYNL